MRRECRERFPRHRLQRKLLVKDPGMMHVGIANPRYGGEENVGATGYYPNEICLVLFQLKP